MSFNKITKNLFKKKNLFTKDHVILILLLVIFSLNIDLFRKSYFIVGLDHDSRQSKLAYDYCESTGTGYIFYIKKKFNLKKLPKIKNLGGTKPTTNQGWIFNTNHVQDENKLIILFNLDRNNKFRFDFNNYNVEDNYKNDCLYLTKK